MSFSCVQHCSTMVHPLVSPGCCQRLQKHCQQLPFERFNATDGRQAASRGVEDLPFGCSGARKVASQIGGERHFWGEPPAFQMHIRTSFLRFLRFCWGIPQRNPQQIPRVMEKVGADHTVRSARLRQAEIPLDEVTTSWNTAGGHRYSWGVRTEFQADLIGVKKSLREHRIS